MNQPKVTGNRFEITRTDLVTSLPYVDLWPDRFRSELTHTVGTYPHLQYQYDGKLYGWTIQPQTASISVVGGPGKEFWVEDPLSPGTGTNWNQCMAGQCAANSEGLGPADNYINPDAKTAPHEPGSWRIEVKPTIPATQDFFLHVMLATTSEDSNVPVNVTVPANLAAGMVGATWTDNSKTYTVSFPQDEVGGHITISGAGGVNENLMSAAQPLPAQLQIVSGASQSAAAGSAVPDPLLVVVKDSSGNPLPNVVVHYGVTQGSGRISIDTATTDSHGEASVALTLPATATGPVSVMADVNGLPPVEFSANVSGSTVPVVSALTCTPTSLISLARSICSISLSQPAGTAGATIQLASSSHTLTVPTSLSIPSGGSTATFPAIAGNIANNQAAVITASLNGSSQTAFLTLVAASTLPPPPSPALTSLSCASTTLTSNASSVCTVTLSGAANPAGTTVAIASSSPMLVVPSSISIANGTSATFLAKTGTVTATQTAVITATLSDDDQSVSLTLLSASPPSGGIAILPNTWTMVPTNGYPVQTVGYEKLVYASSPVKKAVMLGNYHEFSTEPNQALIAYDFDSNRWDVLDVGDSFHTENMPDAGHPVGAFAYDPTLQSFIYYCCASGSNQAQNTFGTWWFDFFGQAGRSKQTSPKPGTPQYESSAFDSLDNRYVLQGGNSFEGTWTYDPSTNAYQKQPPSGTPPDASVNQPAMTYNTADHKVYLFGGQIGSAFSNDLFAYNEAANIWTKLDPSGTRPSPRWRSGLAYDSTNNVLLLYGGQDASHVYNDTWIYNPSANSWTQLHLAQSPPTDSAGPFENLAYDSDYNVFILVLRGGNGYANGGSIQFGAQTWMFRYLGIGPNPGGAPLTVAASAGSLNQNADDWAKEPSIASSGNTLYAAWVETGEPFDKTNNAWFHVYAKQQGSSGAWAAMAGSPASLDSEFNKNSESHSPSFSVVAGIPWISWYKWNNAGQEWAIWAKSWNGSAWSGGPIGVVGQKPAVAFQGRSQMTDVAGVPYIAFLEVDKSFLPQKTFLYVKYWNGRQWILRGNGALNISSAGNTTADSVSIVSDGTNPYVAWTEYTSDNLQQNLTPPQVHVAHWNGTQWAVIGGSLNVNANSWATDASIAYMAGQPYVAWTERTTSGNNQVFVKTFNGTNWATVGSGSLNRSANTGWAFRPSLATDTTNNILYLAWVEQQNLGQRAQTYVSRFSGGVWSALGSSLNADAALGSAQRVSLTLIGGQPVAAWGEVKYGSLRQVFVKKWTGSRWSLLSASK